ncbi:hypothetical protein [Corallococcus llansteffanensis]|uniref:Uncharacterized protein n=1 Tax=Corallococcus llansteffanensis TaxID=2316731 RepID=A0A3A8P6Y7_9BACT|nr:hypothetical protein [Corallococcus llansteffanensis]RKH52277.1 hypothetical protein D7V93_28245 [Corallococcus llansteffanensis]
MSVDQAPIRKAFAKANGVKCVAEEEGAADAGVVAHRPLLGAFEASMETPRTQGQLRRFAPGRINTHAHPWQFLSRWHGQPVGMSWES